MSSEQLKTLKMSYFCLFYLLGYDLSKPVLKVMPECNANWEMIVLDLFYFKL